MNRPEAAGAPPAPYLRRMLAVLVDALLAAVCVLPLVVGALPDLLVAPPAGLRGVLVVVGLVLGLTLAVRQWWTQGTRGWTIGRRLFGLRTVDTITREPLGLARAAGRTLVVVLASLVCGVGMLVLYLSVLWDPSGHRRGWHDRIAEAVVVDVRGADARRRAAGRTATVDEPEPVDRAWFEPAEPPADGADPAPAPSGPVERTRWVGMASEGLMSGPGLVLPPLQDPGPEADRDTLSLPMMDAVRAAAARAGQVDERVADDAAVEAAAADERPAEAHLTGDDYDALLALDPFWDEPTGPGPGAAARAGAGGDEGAGWAVRLPDGTLLDLDVSPVLLGRNPVAQDGVRSVPVSDPGRSVSKTHLLLSAGTSGAWVTDRGSTNGTLVTLPDGERVLCLPHQRVRLVPGSVVSLGDLAVTVGLRQA